MNRFLLLFKKWHRWPALVFSVFFLLWAASGIILNHRQLFSGMDVDRNFLPQEYRYQNWNNAAVKASLPFDDDRHLIFGNIGVWLTDNEFSRFSDFNAGFPPGIDHRKIFCMIRSEKGNLYAGTLFGLYHYHPDLSRWQKIALDIHPERITSILEREGKIIVMTRSEILEADDDPADFRVTRHQLPPAKGYDDKVGLFRTLWVIHSGEIYGMAGRLLIDLAGIILIILTVTGIIHYVSPFILRRRKKRELSLVKVSRLKRFSIRWHKKLGIWIAVLLLINTLTGMFLRPPLLITIADAKVNKIPFSLLDSRNAWSDKLRDMVYDPRLGGYLVSTSEGIYLTDSRFHSSPVPLPGQPPVSVMGINAFLPQEDGSYLVGSFSGLYRWNPQSEYAVNFLTGDVPTGVSSAGRPLSEHMVSGYLALENNREFYLDYNLGAVPVYHSLPLPPMPGQILESSPMSLWNLALEIHTARILKVVMGDFYILIIPLLGLFGSIILITGIVVWIKLFLRKRASKKNCEHTSN